LVLRQTLRKKTTRPRFSTAFRDSLLSGFTETGSRTATAIVLGRPKTLLPGFYRMWIECGRSPLQFRR